MYDYGLRERVRGMLDRGLSFRAVSRELGVSRTFVRRISLLTSDCEDNEFAYFSEDYSRCETCGGLVKKPCLACELRRGRLRA